MKLTFLISISERKSYIPSALRMSNISSTSWPSISDPLYDQTTQALGGSNMEQSIVVLSDPDSPDRGARPWRPGSSSTPRRAGTGRGGFRAGPGATRQELSLSVQARQIPDSVVDELAAQHRANQDRYRGEFACSICM